MNNLKEILDLHLCVLECANTSKDRERILCFADRIAKEIALVEWDAVSYE